VEIHFTASPNKRTSFPEESADSRIDPARPELGVLAYVSESNRF
jgi:hypothetical protein